MVGLQCVSPSLIGTNCCPIWITPVETFPPRLIKDPPRRFDESHLQFPAPGMLHHVSDNAHPARQSIHAREEHLCRSSTRHAVPRYVCDELLEANLPAQVVLVRRVTTRRTPPVPAPLQVYVRHQNAREYWLPSRRKAYARGQ